MEARRAVSEKGVRKGRVAKVLGVDQGERLHMYRISTPIKSPSYKN